VLSTDACGWNVFPMCELPKADGDQDNRALAVSGDTVYLTYTEFSHSNREAESFAQRQQAPANFDWLSRPAAAIKSS
jgi:hypothetical protein